MKIDNHPSILEAKPVIVQSNCVPHRIVLRKDDSSYHPYVTHMENLKLVGDTLVHEDFYWGNYFMTLEEAKRDFESR